ncbi:hypothetical protein DMUE_1170 [Dictyocoela muelleri]|nr:hypothetical protein DMUE_1170 [Dictyocoela muelleri]
MNITSLINKKFRTILGKFIFYHKTGNSNFLFFEKGIVILENEKLKEILHYDETKIKIKDSYLLIKRENDVFRISFKDKSMLDKVYKIVKKHVFKQTISDDKEKRNKSRFIEKTYQVHESDVKNNKINTFTDEDDRKNIISKDIKSDLKNVISASNNEFESDNINLDSRNKNLDELNCSLDANSDSNSLKNHENSLNDLTDNNSNKDFEDTNSLNFSNDENDSLNDDTDSLNDENDSLSDGNDLINNENGVLNGENDSLNDENDLLNDKPEKSIENLKNKSLKILKDKKKSKKKVIQKLLNIYDKNKSDPLYYGSVEFGDLRFFIFFSSLNFFELKRKTIKRVGEHFYPKTRIDEEMIDLEQYKDFQLFLKYKEKLYLLDSDNDLKAGILFLNGRLDIVIDYKFR